MLLGVGNAKPLVSGEPVDHQAHWEDDLSSNPKGNNMNRHFLSKTAIPACFLAAMIVSCVCAPAYAAAEVSVEWGIVEVDLRDGTVLVIVEKEVYIPSNGHGLLRSGQIAPGDVVRVKIVRHRKHTHRGHVTVLK